MNPVASILQAAVITFFAILSVLLVVFSALVGPRKKKKLLPQSEEASKEQEVLVKQEDEQEREKEDEEKQRQRERQEQQEQEEEQRRVSEQFQKEREEQSIRPIYERYPRIYRFEILYWRAVRKPWWWNNYAKELVEYAEEYFPIQKVNFFAMYNSNSKADDYNYPPYHNRIVSLRPHKISKHPLVVINWDQEMIMVDSYYALQEMLDRIDAEWYRHYGFKKTYRHSPTSYKAS